MKTMRICPVEVAVYKIIAPSYVSVGNHINVRTGIPASDDSMPRRPVDIIYGCSKRQSQHRNQGHNHYPSADMGFTKSSKNTFVLAALDLERELEPSRRKLWPGLMATHSGQASSRSVSCGIPSLSKKLVRRKELWPSVYEQILLPEYLFVSLILLRTS